jgi:glycosyltransferase involved in cell wall biosynthesis
MAEKLRILILLEATAGGTRKHIIELQERVNLDKFEVTFGYSTLRADSQFLNALPKLQQRGIRLVELPMTRGISIGDARSFFKILRLIRTEKFHIVHCHSSKAGFLGRLAGKLAFTGTRTIFTPHVLSTHANKNYWIFEKVASWFTDVAIAVSESERDDFRRQHLFAEHNSTTITVGVDCSIEHPHFLIRQNLKIPKNAILIATVGRFGAQKNPLAFFEVVRLVVEQTREFHFIWIGDGELRKEAETFIVKYKLQSNCHLIGWQDSPEMILADCDIFALTSHYEGCPYVCCEAMLMKLPIVATDVMGTRSVVTDGETGHLISDGNWKEFAHTILELAENTDMRMRMGIAGKKRVEELFNI